MIARQDQQDNHDNPLQTQGFAFVEYATPNPQRIQKLFKNMGFMRWGKHPTQPIEVYGQGRIVFILNQTQGFSSDFAAKHGDAVCGFGMVVANPSQALERAIKRGGVEKACPEYQTMRCIDGIGGSRLYLVDQNFLGQEWGLDLHALSEKYKGFGLGYIDHLTHNVYRGQMDIWAEFYQRIFNFRQIRYFDIQGQHTGLISRAMTSPCGHIRIPINESTDDRSQIEEYLREYKGEGVQHIALATDDIYSTVELLRQHEVTFLDVPQAYYEMLDQRLPEHQENIERMSKNAILLDGTLDPTTQSTDTKLLQIFTQTTMGPIFFEIIQRKGNQGFGEGNFQALFDAIERDQIKRGVLKVDQS